MRRVTITILLLTLIMSFSACKSSKKACERACQCVLKRMDTPDNPDAPDELLTDAELDDCIEQCVDDMDKESDSCQDNFYEWARCMDTNVCNPDACDSEMNKMEQSCDTFYTERFVSTALRSCDRICECTVPENHTLDEWATCMLECKDALDCTPPLFDNEEIWDERTCGANFSEYTRCVHANNCSPANCELANQCTPEACADPATTCTPEQCSMAPVRPCDQLCACKNAKGYTIADKKACLLQCQQAYNDTKVDPETGLGGTSSEGCQRGFLAYSNCLAINKCDASKCTFEIVVTATPTDTAVPSSDSETDEAPDAEPDGGEADTDTQAQDTDSESQDTDTAIDVPLQPECDAVKGIII